MKLKITDDKELKALIQAQLKANAGYCPCVLNSKGQQDFKCPCKMCREELNVGDSCHCGLYERIE